MILKQKLDTLRAITLNKNELCWKNRGKACAYGRSKRAYITKELVASPIVSMEALLSQLIIGTF